MLFALASKLDMGLINISLSVSNYLFFFLNSSARYLSKQNRSFAFLATATVGLVILCFH